MHERPLAIGPSPGGDILGFGEMEENLRRRINLVGVFESDERERDSSALFGCLVAKKRKGRKGK